MPPSLCFPCLKWRGITLIELMLGLAISAILMLAMAVAVHAGAKSFASNHSYQKATQIGRLSVMRIAKDLRTAHAIQIGAATGVVNGSAGSGTALYIAPTPTSSAAYIYDSAGQRLFYDTNPAAASDTPSISDLVSRMPENASPPSVFVVARDVRSVAFSCTYYNGTADTVGIRMVVGNPYDDTTFACEQSVVPRKAVPPATAPAPTL